MIKLLIVDDESITRDTLRDHVPWSELGIDRVETAKNGVTALETAKCFSPDIMLCDVRMPKMDGIELGNRIKELYPECKIIFLSGYSDKEYLKSAIQMQAVDYIEKPINFKEIEAVIRRAVDMHHAQKQNTGRSRLTAAAFYGADNQMNLPVSREHSPFHVSRSFFIELKELLRKGNTTEAAKLVAEVSENAYRCQDQNIDHVKNIFFNLLMTIYDLAKESGFSEEIQKDDRSYIWQIVENSNRLSGLVDYALSGIRETAAFIDDLKFNSKVKEIIEYINNHYSDSTLSTKVISAHMYFTQSYLCVFFKKNTGKTINEYLTDIRIEKAKELLKEKSLRLFDIAEQVGFSDPNYFSAIFKKQTGYSPTEYRETYVL